MKKRFSDEQIITILREAEAGFSARELCRKHAISDATFYTWRKKYSVNDNGERLPDGAIACRQAHERAGAGELSAAHLPL